MYLKRVFWICLSLTIAVGFVFGIYIYHDLVKFRQKLTDYPDVSDYKRMPTVSTVKRVDSIPDSAILSDSMEHSKSDLDSEFEFLDGKFMPKQEDMTDEQYRRAVLHHVENVLLPKYDAEIERLQAIADNLPYREPRTFTEAYRQYIYQQARAGVTLDELFADPEFQRLSAENNNDGDD